MQKLCILGLLSILTFSCANEKKDLISYTISPKTSETATALKIRMQCAAEDDGQTVLLFQNTAWGQDSLHKVVVSMELLNAKGTAVKQGDSAIVITHPKNLKTLDFEYIFQQDSDTPLTTHKAYRPVIQPEFFHLFSHKMFMLPREVLEQSEDNFDVSLTWTDFPESYVFQNSFGSELSVQMIKNTSEEDFHTAVFVGGDFRIQTLQIQDNQVALAIRGEWETFEDEELLSILENTVQTQRDFYNDHSQEYFSVTMIPTFLENGSSFQGSGLTNSFALSASNNDNLEIEGLVYLLNHELQHNWIGHVIRNDNEEEQYWFSEGFTDYYTIKNIAKKNIHGLDGAYYISEFNSFVRALYTSPVKNFPNADINYETFWSNPDLGKLPYRRGAVYAFYLDEKIKSDSEGTLSLDDVMLQLLDDAENDGKKITHEHFIKTVNEFTLEDISTEFEAFIENGELIDLAALYTSMGLDYEATQEVFDLGFTFSEDRKTILSVDETSAAYKAGIRQGDYVASRSYYFDSIKYPAEFTVVRNNKEINVTYMPIATRLIPKIKASKENIELLKL